MRESERGGRETRTPDNPHAPRRQYRPRRDLAQRARRAPPDPVRAARSPSRPAPMASPRICARTAAISATRTWRGSSAISQAAQFRDGGDRRHGGDRPRYAAARRLPRPGKAQERTTEGGLDVVGGHDQLTGGQRLRRAGVRVSLFIAPIRADRGCRLDRSPGDRIAYRRLVRRAWSASTKRRPRRELRVSRRGRAASGSDSNARGPRTRFRDGGVVAGCRKSSSSISAIF